MERAVFNDLVRKLSAYYERSAPKADTLNLWFSKVRQYPDEVIPWMTRTIGDRFDVFPKNLPNVVRQLWGEWLNANPDKQSSYQYRECSDPWCDQGEIHAGKMIDDRYQVFAFSCRVCRQNRNGWPLVSSIELEQQGYSQDTAESTRERMRGSVSNYKLGQVPTMAMTVAWGEKEWAQHLNSKQRSTA